MKYLVTFTELHCIIKLTYLRSTPCNISDVRLDVECNLKSKDRTQHVRKCAVVLEVT